MGAPYIYDISRLRVNVVVGRINLCRIIGAEVNDELERMWKLVVVRILDAVRHLPGMSEAKEENPSG